MQRALCFPAGQKSRFFGFLGFLFCWFWDSYAEFQWAWPDQWPNHKKNVLIFLSFYFWWFCQGTTTTTTTTTATTTITATTTTTTINMRRCAVDREFEFFLYIALRSLWNAFGERSIFWSSKGRILEFLSFVSVLMLSPTNRRDSGGRFPGHF